MLVLAIDASTYTGSVALLRDDAILGETVAAMRGEHEERLMPAVAALLAEHQVNVDELDAIACGAGPGSFTSLRIAASIAKGLSAAREIPLLVAPSTLLVVAGARPKIGEGKYIVALDAMRGDFFCQVVDVSSEGVVVPGESWRESRGEIERRASETGASIVGPAEVDPVSPHARGFVTLIRDGVAQQVELTRWEPEYGRKAEAQVRWETAHGRELGTH